jgi:hypothetical protein
VCLASRQVYRDGPNPAYVVRHEIDKGDLDGPDSGIEQQAKFLQVTLEMVPDEGMEAFSREDLLVGREVDMAWDYLQQGAYVLITPDVVADDDHRAKQVQVIHIRDLKSLAKEGEPDPFHEGWPQQQEIFLKGVHETVGYLSMYFTRLLGQKAKIQSAC